MKQIVLLIILTAVFVVSGCKTMEPEKNQPLSVNLSEKFFFKADGGRSADVLPLFSGYEELKILINDALNNNFDLKILNARISQAKAMVAKEKSRFFPTLGFSFGGQRNRVQIKNEHGRSSTYTSSHSWDGSLQGSYTADIWGEARADSKSQELKSKAAIWDMEQSKLELTTTMAQVWIDIISVRTKKRILLGQIKNNNTLLELQKLRFLNGRAKALEVSQQHEALAQASSQMPLLEKQEHLLLNTLIFLSGKTRSDNVQVKTKKLPVIIHLPMIGVPLDLLDNRPDIQAARFKLSSSQWKILAAKADLLPSFNLTYQALFSSGKLDLLFQNWVAALAGSIAGPVFDGGLRKTEVARVKAVAKEQLNIYAVIVAKAIQEVEDTLVSIQKQAVYIKLLEQELEAVRLTLKDARIQYLNGQSSYLNYLVAWTGIERLERQLVSERGAYLKDCIELYKVLGLKFGI